jgi:hypothetical protein
LFGIGQLNRACVWVVMNHGSQLTYLLRSRLGFLRRAGAVGDCEFQNAVLLPVLAVLDH